MDNNSENNKKVINVETLLNQKRAREAQALNLSKSNIKKRNEQIADYDANNLQDNLLGEAQIDLENRILDKRYEVIKEFNKNYMEMTNQVLNRLNMKATAEANLINSAEDEAIEVDFEEINQLPFIAPRQSRFSNGLLLGSSEETEINSLPSSEDINSTKPSRFIKEIL